MPTVRQGNQAVQLVVDVQVGVMNESRRPPGSSATWRTNGTATAEAVEFGARGATQ
jgi:hypothetical protein